MPLAQALVADTITRQKSEPVARGVTVIGLVPQTLVAPNDRAQLAKVEKTLQGPHCTEFATLPTMVILDTIIAQIASLTTGPLLASILPAADIPTHIYQVTHRQSRLPEPTVPST